MARKLGWEWQEYGPGPGVRTPVKELIELPASPRIPPAIVIHDLALDEIELLDATSDNEDPMTPMAVHMMVTVRLVQPSVRIDLEWSFAGLSSGNACSHLRAHSEIALELVHISHVPPDSERRNLIDLSAIHSQTCMRAVDSVLETLDDSVRFQRRELEVLSVHGTRSDTSHINVFRMEGFMSSFKCLPPTSSALRWS